MQGLVLLTMIAGWREGGNDSSAVTVQGTKASEVEVELIEQFHHATNLALAAVAAQIRILSKLYFPMLRFL